VLLHLFGLAAREAGDPYVGTTTIWPLAGPEAMEDREIWSISVK
jgi:hypothetical protein